jgi:hypothetical protein
MSSSVKDHQCEQKKRQLTDRPEDNLGDEVVSIVYESYRCLRKQDIVDGYVKNHGIGDKIEVLQIENIPCGQIPS